MQTRSTSAGFVPELFLVRSPKAFVLKARLTVFSCCGRSAQIFISPPITGPVCAQAHANTVYREGCVCARIPGEQFIVCNMCPAQFCLQTYVVVSRPVGDWAVAPCQCLLVQVCYGHSSQKGSSRKRHLHHLDPDIDFHARGLSDRCQGGKGFFL